MYSNPLKRAAEEIAAEIRSAAGRACAEGALKTETPGPRPSDANGAYCRAVHAPGLELWGD